MNKVVKGYFIDVVKKEITAVDIELDEISSTCLDSGKKYIKNSNLLILERLLEEKEDFNNFIVYNSEHLNEAIVDISSIIEYQEELKTDSEKELEKENEEASDDNPLANLKKLKNQKQYDGFCWNGEFFKDMILSNALILGSDYYDDYEDSNLEIEEIRRNITFKKYSSDLVLLINKKNQKN